MWRLKNIQRIAKEVYCTEMMGECSKSNITDNWKTRYTAWFRDNCDMATECDT